MKRLTRAGVDVGGVLMILLLLLLTPGCSARGVAVQEVRLAGGGGRDGGRVEVKVGGRWGTVCDDGWDHRDASVVCRMLQMTGGLAYSEAYYGQGTGPIVLDSVDCGGDEANLNLCTLGLPGATSSCGHHEDAGVQCGVDPPDLSSESSIVPGALTTLGSNCDRDSSNIRLVGSEGTPSSGFVQVRDPSKGVKDFGFVCDDGWSLLNAKVVCRQLCYDPSQAQPGWHRPLTLRPPTAPMVVLDKVTCTGRETSLADCAHLPWTVHDCSLSELAAVTCLRHPPSPQVPQPEVECQDNQMVVTFTKRTNPTILKADIVPADDVSSTCRPVTWEDGTRIKVTLAYQQCAVILQESRGSPSSNLTIVSSIVVPVTFTPSPGNGTPRVTEYKVKLQCQMEATYSATRRLPDVAQPVVPASGTTRLTVSMDLYRDDTFTDLVKSQDLVLTPGGWINMGVRLTTGHQLKLVVSACFAGPDLSDVTKPRQALLLDKCPQEDTVSTYTLSDTFWGIRFRPFSFPSFSDVTVQCQAYACKKETISRACDRSCNASSSKHTPTKLRRRLRRALRMSRSNHPDMAMSYGSQSAVSMSRSNHPDMAMSYGSHSAVSMSRGNHPDMAMSYGSQSAVSMSRGNHPDMAMSYGSQSAVSMPRGNHPDMVMSYGSQSAVFMPRGNHPDMAMSYGSQSAVSMSRGKQPEIYSSKLLTAIRLQTR